MKSLLYGASYKPCYPQGKGDLWTVFAKKDFDPLPQGTDVALINKRFVRNGTVERWVELMEKRHRGKHSREEWKRIALDTLREVGVGVGKPIKNGGRARLKRGAKHSVKK